MQISNLPFWYPRGRGVCLCNLPYECFTWAPLWPMNVIAYWCDHTCSFTCFYLRKIIQSSLAPGKPASPFMLFFPRMKTTPRESLRLQDETPQKWHNHGSHSLQISWWHVTEIVFTLSQRKGWFCTNLPYKGKVTTYWVKIMWPE